MGKTDDPLVLEALGWWRNTLSINEQNALMDKHFSNMGHWYMEQMPTWIAEMYDRERTGRTDWKR
jgi:hypothetical protein